MSTKDPEQLPNELLNDLNTYFVSVDERRYVENLKGSDILTSVVECLPATKLTVKKLENDCNNFISKNKKTVTILAGLFSDTTKVKMNFKTLQTDVKCFVLASQLGIKIFVLRKEGGFRWTCYPPLIRDIVSECSEVVTVFKTENTFYPITANGEVTAPNIYGFINYAEDDLRETDPGQIVVSHIVCKVDENIFRDIMKDIISKDRKGECKAELRTHLEKRNLDFEGTFHRINDAGYLWEQNNEKFREACIQVLVKYACLEMLKSQLPDFEELVQQTSYLQKRKVCADLRNLFNQLWRTSQSAAELSDELDARRCTVNKAVIGTSVTGITATVLGIVGVALLPVTFGASLGLSIAGGILGIGSGAVQGGFRIREAVKQNSSTKVLNENIQKVYTEMMEPMQKFHELFQPPCMCQHDSEKPGINVKGFMSVGNVYRTLHNVTGIALPAAKASASAVTTVSYVLFPISIALDVAFLADAAVSLKRKKKTGATEILECSYALATCLTSIYAGEVGLSKHFL